MGSVKLSDVAFSGALRGMQGISGGKAAGVAFLWKSFYSTFFLYVFLVRFSCFGHGFDQFVDCFRGRDV